MHIIHDLFIVIVILYSFVTSLKENYSKIKV